MLILTAHAELAECYESPHRAAMTRGESTPRRAAHLFMTVHPILSASQINSGPKRAVRPSHSVMLRRPLAAFWVCLSMAVIVIYSAGVSHASPSNGDETGQCSFVLTPPKVAQVSGLSVVVATLRPGPCTMHASPNLSVVCISVAGSGSPGECASKNGQEPAEVRFPYQPGSTYVVRAQGCASLFEPPYTLCQNFGPSNTTL
jgi:hypothetical protein